MALRPFGRRTCRKARRRPVDQREPSPWGCGMASKPLPLRRTPSAEHLQSKPASKNRSSVPVARLRSILNGRAASARSSFSIQASSRSIGPR